MANIVANTDCICCGDREQTISCWPAKSNFEPWQKYPSQETEKSSALRTYMGLSTALIFSQTSAEKILNILNRSFPCATRSSQEEAAIFHLLSQRKTWRALDWHRMIIQGLVSPLPAIWVGDLLQLSVSLLNAEWEHGIRAQCFPRNAIWAKNHGAASG